MMPRVGSAVGVNVVFPDHTHFFETGFLLNSTCTNLAHRVRKFLGILVLCKLKKICVWKGEVMVSYDCISS